MISGSGPFSAPSPGFPFTAILRSLKVAEVFRAGEHELIGALVLTHRRRDLRPPPRNEKARLDVRDEVFIYADESPTPP
jgi:hypothetical protein